MTANPPAPQSETELTPRIQNVGNQVADYMDEILRFFKPGAKITVLVRCPEKPDGSRDFVQTNDTLDDAIKALTTRKTGPSLEGQT